MSENLELVRSIYADWQRGDFGRPDWVDPEIEYVWIGGPAPGAWTGVTEMIDSFRYWLGAWQKWRVHGDELRELDGDRVLAFVHASGRGKTSGIDLSSESMSFVQVFHISDHKVTRLLNYFDRAGALADLGIEE
jgi:ketosteroid isomerase-like protein